MTASKVAHLCQRIELTFITGYIYIYKYMYLYIYLKNNIILLISSIHYLFVSLDQIFKKKNFNNSISTNNKNEK